MSELPNKWIVMDRYEDANGTLRVEFHNIRTQEAIFESWEKGNHYLFDNYFRALNNKNNLH